MYTIYSTETCNYCKMAKNLFEEMKLPYQEVKITSEETLKILENRLGYPPRTVPQIWLDNNHIGGYDDLVKSMKW